MDLLNFPHQAGGLNHIVTVLAELQENMDPDKLLALAKSNPVLAWKQRLGYLLETVEAAILADILKKYLAQQNRVDYTPLLPGLAKSTEAPRNSTWKIIENATVESDL